MVSVQQMHRQAGRSRFIALSLMGITALASWHLSVVTSASFVTGSSGSSILSRRLAAGAVLPVLLGAQEALAMPRVTDRDVYINNRKLALVPIFKQGMDYLEKKGIDERMAAFAPKMYRKMTLYAGLFSQTEQPDATVKRLLADSEVFKTAIDKGSKEDAVAAFEQFRTHVPKGVGYFDLKVPSTYEAPPP
mmetsp:Transcript_97140/g.244933  ORF Transcript_97140/g.244933 Transcript_97140/m.244933 type:complete len:191 (-) Transcript_97140:129-701(-)